ncbi:MAG: prolyl oligopeptidase family serine peptidase [Planctomycetota bacterium]|nr:prolyl oligopeptidase family serine peptidase [Planctomycetota bacterium]
MTVQYPVTKAVPQSDKYHGQTIDDPFRWLEDVDSVDTQDWVKHQNEVTFAFLKSSPKRNEIKDRLTQLWNYERYGFPSKHGDHYLVTHNNGLQNQSVLYIADSLEAERRVLLDPNTLVADGTVALTGHVPSDDGKLLAYGLATAGSDWNTWQVRDIASGKDLDDKIEWVKFSSVSWTGDNLGFFYSRYDKPSSDAEFTGVNYFQKLYYHKIGTSQDDDILVYHRPEEKEWGFGGAVTEDHQYLVISVWRGTEKRNQVFYAKLDSTSVSGATKVAELLAGFDSDYQFIGNDGSVFYFKTDNGAAKRRIIAVDIDNPAREQWKEIVPESEETIESVSLFGDRFFVTYLKDATSVVRQYSTSGERRADLELPPLGTVAGLGGKRSAHETFYSFTNYITPPTVYRLNLTDNSAKPWRQPKLVFDPSDFVTERVFYKSKDGTRIPMILSHKKGLERNGKLPTLLYAYGGFNISITPTFSPANLAWMEMGGVYAVPNLRGGGEYGREWHEAGMLNRKQNVFDDFIAAAEYLVEQKITNPSKLAIQGRSNGGLLVGATMAQRPELFAVALPGVGVLDMLRFHKFTIGWAWVNEFGSSDDPEQFKTLLAYSPLHNIKPGMRYPATLITTADHDDRVVPGHSFKFAARLQASQSGPKPALIRIETSAGHGAGTPVSKLVETAADTWAFVLKNFENE